MGVLTFPGLEAPQEQLPALEAPAPPVVTEPLQLFTPAPAVMAGQTTIEGIN